MKGQAQAWSQGAAVFDHDMSHRHRRYTEHIDGASSLLKAACFVTQCVDGLEIADDGYQYCVAFGELPGQFTLAVLRAYPSALVLIVSKTSSFGGIITAGISPRDAFEVWAGRCKEFQNHPWVKCASYAWSDLWVGTVTEQIAAYEAMLGWFGGHRRLRQMAFKCAGATLPIRQVCATDAVVRELRPPVVKGFFWGLY